MKLLSFLAAMLIRTIRMSVRLRHVHAENVTGTPQYILSFWHAHLLLMVHSLYRRPIAAMISQSKDGEIIARVLDWYRAESVRGSSTRGGRQALREIIRAAQEGKNIAFTPDGPKGPPRVLKDGVIYAAQATGLPIVPVAFAAKKKTLLRSWDRMVVPRPLSKAIFLYGQPIVVPRDGDAAEWRVRVEQAMNQLADEAESNFDELWKERPRESRRAQ